MKPDFTKDKAGLRSFSHYLISQGFYNIQTTLPYTAWDLEADWKGQHFYFELKVRPKVALDGTYNDTICEQYKLVATPDINHSYIVNLFTDKMSIIPYTAPYEVQYKLCQKTNNWNRNKVMKTILSFRNEEKYLYDYE